MNGNTTSVRRIARRISFGVAVAGASLFMLGGMSPASAQSTTSGASSTATADAARGNRPAPLTDAQKACLTSKGVTIPSRPAPGTATSGTKPTPPTAEQRAAFAAAATACGITLPTPGQGGPGGHGGPGGPGGPGRPQLTDTQKTCLTGKGITLPTPPAQGSATAGVKPTPPTAEQRAAFATAAAACGITLPTPPAGAAGSALAAKA